MSKENEKFSLGAVVPSFVSLYILDKWMEDDIMSEEANKPDW